MLNQTTPAGARKIAKTIMQAALDAVSPYIALKNYFTEHASLTETLQNCTGKIIVVGAGKASAPMALAVTELFGDKITAGQIIVKYGHTETLPADSPVNIVEAGHPVPDEAGMQATRAMLSLLQQTTAADVVLCLISGGGSALLTQPAAGLSLADLQTTNQQLLAAGATINEINTIRKHLSAVKGGRLAELAAPAPVYSLILSDVVGDPLEVIASGPTVPDPTTFAEAWQIVQQYQLAAQLPAPVVQRLQGADNFPDTPKPDNTLFETVHNIIIGSNRMAAQAGVHAAEQAGFAAHLLTTYIEGEAREVARVMVGLAKGVKHGEAPISPPACLVLGGETTVTVRGKGRGGRNQELALAAAIALEGWSGVLLACLGTDGNDGPTDAAGAFADGDTVSRGQALNMNALDYLHNNDAYNFFAPIDDLIITGPTNTNVNDLTFIFVW